MESKPEVCQFLEEVEVRLPFSLLQQEQVMKSMLSLSLMKRKMGLEVLKNLMKRRQQSKQEKLQKPVDLQKELSFLVFSVLMERQQHLLLLSLMRWLMR